MDDVGVDSIFQLSLACAARPAPGARSPSEREIARRQCMNRES